MNSEITSTQKLLLAIDIGNTQVVAGLYTGVEWIANWRMSSLVQRTEDENWLIFRSLCADQGIDWRQITGVALSSVVPNVTQTFQHMASKYLKLEPVVVNARLDLGIRILYDNPLAVGADRLCNAVAGYARWGGPLIILDFGTATTFDVISASGEYMGGIIAPGVQTTATVLHQVASLLPRVELKFPPKIIATNTETSIQAGLMFGTIDMVNGLIRRIKAEFTTEVRTVATGGLARMIVPRLESVQFLEPMLTLDGLAIIFNRVKDKS